MTILTMMLEQMMNTKQMNQVKRNSSWIGLAVIALIMIGLIINSDSLLNSTQERPFIPAGTSAAQLNLENIQMQWQRLIKNNYSNTDTTADNNTPAPLIFIHLWNPSCLCNAVSQRHVAEVIEEFDESMVQWWVVTPPSTSRRQIDQYRDLNPRIEKIVQLTAEQTLPLTSSPGLAITQANGELNYYGAYGFGMDCVPSGENFFTNIIGNIRQGATGPFLNVAGNGCFCEWPKN